MGRGGVGGTPLCLERGLILVVTGGGGGGNKRVNVPKCLKTRLKIIKMNLNLKEVTSSYSQGLNMRKTFKYREV